MKGGQLVKEVGVRQTITTLEECNPVRETNMDIVAGQHGNHYYDYRDVNKMLREHRT